MVRCTTPKRVTLPNGRTFTATFKHATRRDLPANVCLQRPYKQRAAPKGKRRRQPHQGGRGFKSAFGKLFKIAKKVGKSKAFRNIAKTALEEAWGIVQNLSRNVKNKRL